MLPRVKASRDSLTFLSPEDIAASMIYALKAPDHEDVSELFILPTEKIW